MDSLTTIPDPQSPTLDLYREQWVGPRADFYILRWAAMQNRVWSWNWSAFFFGEGWLLYRKMYLQALLFCLIRWMITPFLDLPLPFNDPLMNQAMVALIPKTVVLNILLGLFGNHLYRIHADRRIEAVRQQFKPEHVMLALQWQGGVSWLALLWLPLIELGEQILPFLWRNDFSIDWTVMQQTLG